MNMTGFHSRFIAAAAAAAILVVQFGFTASAAGTVAATTTPSPSSSTVQFGSVQGSFFTPGAVETPSITVAPSNAAPSPSPSAPKAPPLAASAAAKTTVADTTNKSSAANKVMIGFHALVYNRQNLAALADFAVKYLAPMGVNTIVVEIDDRFQFKSHPEISGGDVTAADARAFSKKVKAVGMDVIPLYECLGHQGDGGERDALLTAHPDLDETPWVSTSAGLPDFYTPAWCASDPKVYDYVLPAIDELIKAFGATTFNVGMDEVFEIGQDSRCAGTSNAVLFANTVKRLHAHLAAEGVKMMMWGDRLLDGKVLNHSWEADMLGIHTAISMIPRDIIIADWHYERTAYPSTGIFLDHGFTVWPASWKDPTAAINYLNSAKKQAAQRGKSSKMKGMLVTDWSVMPVDLAHAMSAKYSSLTSAEKGLRNTLNAVTKALR